MNVTGTSLTNQPKTTQLDGNNPNTDYTVVDKEVAILDGTYGNVSVNSGGTLKGLGTAARIYISEGGILAPGHSPGTITSTANLTIDGVYHVDLLDKGNYDQTVVGGDVTLNETTSTLDLNFMPGGSVTQGDTFTIIKNNGGHPINGTFSNLAEGGKVTIGNAVFGITYKGGASGNDVVLTALTTAKAPGVPNTGFFAPVLANPMFVAVLGLVSLGALVLVRKTLKR